MKMKFFRLKSLMEQKFKQILYGNSRENKIFQIYFEAINSVNGELIYVSYTHALKYFPKLLAPFLAELLATSPTLLQNAIRTSKKLPIEIE